MPKLTHEALKTALNSLPDWHLDGGKLVRDYKFPGFIEAMAFVNQVAEIAESANHHPDIDIRYNEVRLGLISHDSGGVTSRDINLATRIGRELHQPA
jgi:4a-hydroxytetrahydrobiopterin dehydratase